MSDREWLVTEYCQLVNKNFYFIQKYFEGIVPAGRPDDGVYWRTKEVSEQLKSLVESAVKHPAAYQVVKGGRESEEEVNRLLEEYLNYAAEYLEKGNPWATREQNRRACRNTILTSLQMIANLTVWLEILGEAPAYHVSHWLNLEADWQVHSVHSGTELTGVTELVLKTVAIDKIAR